LNQLFDVYASDASTRPLFTAEDGRRAIPLSVSGESREADAEQKQRQGAGDWNRNNLAQLANVVDENSIRKYVIALYYAYV